MKVISNFSSYTTFPQNSAHLQGTNNFFCNLLELTILLRAPIYFLIFHNTTTTGALLEIGLVNNYDKHFNNCTL